MRNEAASQPFFAHTIVPSLRLLLWTWANPLREEVHSTVSFSLAVPLLSSWRYCVTCSFLNDRFVVFPCQCDSSYHFLPFWNLESKYVPPHQRSAGDSHRDSGRGHSSRGKKLKRFCFFFSLFLYWKESRRESFFRPSSCFRNPYAELLVSTKFSTKSPPDIFPEAFLTYAKVDLPVRGLGNVHSFNLGEKSILHLIFVESRARCRFFDVSKTIVR